VGRKQGRKGRRQEGKCGGEGRKGAEIERREERREVGRKRRERRRKYRENWQGKKVRERTGGRERG
jgi:hypothetical protein